MRILLVQFSRNNEGFPLGLAYVAGTLLETGHQVSFIDLAFEEDPLNALTSKIQTVKPRAIGVTLYTTNYGEFIDLFSKCSVAEGIPVVAGGVHAEIQSEQVLRDGWVDVVARFEGEVIGPKLFQVLESNGDLSSVEGIGFLDENGKCVLTNPPRQYADLDRVPLPAYDLLRVRDYKHTVHGRPAISIVTSRGCPYHCVFCHRGPSSGKRVRCMSVDRIMEELELLRTRYGFHSFIFYDDIFTLHRKRILELCERIVRSGLPIHWTCQTRVNTVNHGLLKWMKRAGCVGIHFGVESGHPAILEHLNKKTTLDDTEQAFAWCREVRIPTVANMMMGTPWDTEETHQATVAFIKKIKPTVTHFFATRPFPGTRLREVFIEKGMAISTHYADYAYYVEGEVVTERGSRYLEQESRIRKICLESTRDIVRSQIRDIGSYPRLLSEYVDMYGLKRFIQETWKRMGVFRWK